MQLKVAGFFFLSMGFRVANFVYSENSLVVESYRLPWLTTCQFMHFWSRVFMIIRQVFFFTVTYENFGIKSCSAEHYLLDNLAKVVDLRNVCVNVFGTLFTLSNKCRLLRAEHCCTVESVHSYYKLVSSWYNCQLFFFSSRHSSVAHSWSLPYSISSLFWLSVQNYHCLNLCETSYWRWNRNILWILSPEYFV